MFSKINYYIFKKFLYSFLITFIILAAILFIGDFVEQFRKTAGKNVPLNIILNDTFLPAVFRNCSTKSPIKRIEANMIKVIKNEYRNFLNI